MSADIRRLEYAHGEPPLGELRRISPRLSWSNEKVIHRKPLLLASFGKHPRVRATRYSQRMWAENANVIGSCGLCSRAATLMLSILASTLVIAREISPSSAYPIIPPCRTAVEYCPVTNRNIPNRTWRPFRAFNGGSGSINVASRCLISATASLLISRATNILPMEIVRRYSRRVSVET